MSSGCSNTCFFTQKETCSPEFVENWKLSFSGVYLRVRGTNQSFQFQWDILGRSLTAKTFFERLYLVLELCKIASWVNSPLCTHNPDHSLYNYFSGSVQCTPQSPPRKAILIVTCHQSCVHLVIFDLKCHADRIIHVRNSVRRSIFQFKFKSEIL